MPKRTVQFMHLATAILLALSANAQYRIIDLGTFGGPTSRASAINERGDVVGESTVQIGAWSWNFAWLWSNGEMKALTPGGNPAMDEVMFQAFGLNNRGQIVGQGAHWEPVIWHEGVMNRGLVGSQGAAFGINDVGQVVGVDMRGAFLWQKGELTRLCPVIGVGASVARAINNLGQIVGHGRCLVDGPYGAFVWKNGRVTEIIVTDPSLVGTTPYAINMGGQVVGQLLTDYFGGGRGFLWENGILIDLSPLTAAYGINDSGDVVGEANGHAALWQNGQVIDLGTLGGSSVARGINNRGEVVGSSVNMSGQEHAVLWKPK